MIENIWSTWRYVVHWKKISIFKAGLSFPFLIPFSYPPHLESRRRVPKHLHLEVSHRTFCSLPNIISLPTISAWSQAAWAGIAISREHWNTVEGSPPIQKAFRFINQLRWGKKSWSRDREIDWFLSIHHLRFYFFFITITKKKIMWSNFFICPCKLFFMLPSNCIPNKVTQFIVNKHIYFLCNIKHIYRGRYLNTVSLPESSQTFFFHFQYLHGISKCSQRTHRNTL